MQFSPGSILTLFGKIKSLQTKRRSLFGKEGNIGLDTFTTHDRSPINETGRPFYDQYGVPFTPEKSILNFDRDRSLRPNLVDWYYNDNPYQGQLPIERQHLENIFLIIYKFSKNNIRIKY